MSLARPDPRQTAFKLLQTRYPSARVIFLAGSVVRGEDTPYSDLDLVVVFDDLAHAYRESLYVDGWPVEAFVHDPATLRYFLFEVERARAVPSLAQMLNEGVEVPGPSPFSNELKELARTYLRIGPPTVGADELQRMRYRITDLVDDIRHPRSRPELVASAGELHEAIATYFFRSRGLWSARGKSIPRKLGEADAAFAARFGDAFEALFARSRTEEVIRLAEDLLAQEGGFLFAGYRHDAPPEWKKAP